MITPRRFTSLLCLALLASACAVEDDVDVDDVAAPDEDPAGRWKPPTGPLPTITENPTTLELFTSTDLNQIAMFHSIDAPTSGLESETLFPTSTLGPNGIYAVRMTCGGRAARFMLFPAANTAPAFEQWNTSLGEWSAEPESVQVDCQPGQQVVYVSQTPLRSGHLLVHASDKRAESAFTGFFKTTWNSGLDGELPDGASREGDPRFLYRSTTVFRLRQDLTLDKPYCFERAAFFELEVRIGAPDQVSVQVVDSYVDEASFPEPWDCRGHMEDSLEDGAQDAAEKLRKTLPSSLAAFSSGACMGRYYLSPDVPSSFSIFWAGPPASAVLCAPPEDD